VVLAPVPVKSGQGLCLYGAGGIPARVQVFNLMGERIADLEFPGGTGCWNTAGTAPGVYVVEVEITIPGGSPKRTLQKIIVLNP
jgi:hypothetical protein